jgi:hypothetical protein
METGNWRQAVAMDVDNAGRQARDGRGWPPQAAYGKAAAPDNGRIRELLGWGLITADRSHRERT